jgi:hypothetical protein
VLTAASLTTAPAFLGAPPLAVLSAGAALAAEAGLAADAAVVPAANGATVGTRAVAQRAAAWLLQKLDVAATELFKPTTWIALAALYLSLRNRH